MIVDGVSSPARALTCGGWFAVAALVLIACDSDVAGGGADGGLVNDGFQDVPADGIEPDSSQEVGPDGRDGDPGSPDLSSSDVGTDPDVDVSADDTPGPSDGGDDACREFVVELKPYGGSVASMMLVVDRSRSMRDDNRWGRMVGAVRDVTATLDDRVRFGLLLFPSPVSDDECATGSAIVAPALDTAPAVSAALDLWEPIGGTPTALSLNTAGDELRAQNPGGENWVLLATDGGPGCNFDLGPGCRCIPGYFCDGFPGNCLDDERTVHAVRALRARGIKTIVVGIPGTEEVRDLLDVMAVEGGTDVDGRHHVVDDLDGLLATLRSTVGAVVPCQFTFRDPPQDLDGLQILVDGVVVPRDRSHVEGWDLETELLTLYGGACDALRDGEAHVIEAEGSCE
jgi:Mg-chelatase subunit ChlD